MYATDFEFDNEKLSDYGMIIATIDGGAGVETVQSGANLSFTQIKPTGSDKFRLYYGKYEECYTTTFQILKSPCGANDQEDLYLTPDLVSQLQRWLCRKNKYYKFKVLDQPKYDDLYWNATFSCSEIQLFGRVIGLELTMTTDAPYAYKDAVCVTYNCKANVPFSLYDESDEIGFIYPYMSINIIGSDGNEDDVLLGGDQLYDFVLSNSLDNKQCKISSCRYGETLILDGENQIITSDSQHSSLPSDFNYYFPKIINDYDRGINVNENIFTVNVDCTITIKYSPIKKVGL